MMHSKGSSAILGKEEKPKWFQLLFLKDDHYQSVEVVETQTIDVEELIGWLNRGEALFIKRKR